MALFGRLPRVVVLASGLLFASSGLSTVPTQFEAEYARAVLAFHDGKYTQALTRLDALRKASPKTIEFIELSALCLSAVHEDGRAMALYEVVMGLTRVEGKGETAAAPYAFELGRILYQQRRFVDARQKLMLALEQGFNRGACHFYLGMVDVDEKLLVSAKEHFDEVLASDADELKPAARMQLAQLAREGKDEDGAVRQFTAARRVATLQLDDDRTSPRGKEFLRQIVASAESELRSLDRSALLLNVGLSAGYDTNVLFVPNGALSSTGGTGAGSVVTLLNYGLTYATSPLRSFQFIPSYRGGVNYNFNQDTRNGEFFTHDVSLYVTKDALAPSQYGLKVEGIYTFQMQADPGATSATLTGYSLVGSFGPYVRLPLSPGWSIGFDTFFQPRRYFLDGGFSPPLRRSGWGQAARVWIGRTSRETWWNPGVAFSAEYDRTNGEEFRGLRFGLDLANSFYLGQSFVGVTSVALSATGYTQRLSGSRQDQTATVTVSGGYRLSRPLSLVATAQGTGNFSNVAAYRYTRLTGTLGVNYLF